MSTASIFPGQGSQSVGMGLDLSENFVCAKAVFEEVDEALGQDLSGLMFAGEADELTKTENAQPALMAVSIAALRVLEQESGKNLNELASYVAGHSLGEYTALCAAGVLPLAETASLLKLRGQAMQRAVPVGQGGMAAIIGPERDQVEAIAAEAAKEAGGKICSLANDNAPGQIVISGHMEAIEVALLIAKEMGAKRALPLPVSAPFHCALMQPAADEMAEAMDNLDFQTPSVPIITNVTAAPCQDPKKLKSLLVEQVTGVVRWRESMASLSGLDVMQVVELGAGKVLTGLMRRIDKSLSCHQIGDENGLQAYLEQAQS